MVKNPQKLSEKSENLDERVVITLRHDDDSSVSVVLNSTEASTGCQLSIYPGQGSE